MPGGLILISPWADPVETYVGTLTDGSPARLNAQSDVHALPEGNVDSFLGYALRALIGPISLEDAGRNPYIAPASLHLDREGGPFKEFPPSYIVTGDAEVFIEQIRTLQSRMKRDTPEGTVVYDTVA